MDGNGMCSTGTGRYERTFKSFVKKETIVKNPQPCYVNTAYIQLPSTKMKADYTTSTQAIGNFPPVLHYQTGLYAKDYIGDRKIHSLVNNNPLTVTEKHLRRANSAMNRESTKLLTSSYRDSDNGMGFSSNDFNSPEANNTTPKRTYANRFFDTTYRRTFGKGTTESPIYTLRYQTLSRPFTTGSVLRGSKPSSAREMSRDNLKEETYDNNNYNYENKYGITETEFDHNDSRGLTLRPMSEYSRRVNIAADKVARSRGSTFNYDNMVQTARLYNQRNNLFRTDKFTTTKMFYHDNAPHLVLGKTSPFTLRNGRFTNSYRSISSSPIQNKTTTEKDLKMMENAE